MPDKKQHKDITSKALIMFLTLPQHQAIVNSEAEYSKGFLFALIHMAETQNRHHSYLLQNFNKYTHNGSNCHMCPKDYREIVPIDEPAWTSVQNFTLKHHLPHHRQQVFNHDFIGVSHLLLIRNS